MKICPKCGSENTNNDKCCKQCGAVLMSKQNTGANIGNNSKRLIFLAGIAAGVLIIGGILFLNGKSAVNNNDSVEEKAQTAVTEQKTEAEPEKVTEKEQDAQVEKTEKAENTINKSDWGDSALEAKMREIMNII